MNARRVAAAEVVILAAMQTRRTAAGVAVALESACLLQSPESAAEARQLQDDVTGACLARWEEERENARLRLAWKSARERAQAYGEGILRHVEERDSYAKWLEQEQGVTLQLRAQVAELQGERHSTNEALSDAAEQLRRDRDQIAELEAERKKYVGVEPTVAEELAYVSRCLQAVHAVCDAAEKQATRWEHPLPVPEWVALVRNAANGVMDSAPELPPAPDPAAEWRRVEAVRPEAGVTHRCGIPLVRRLDCGHCPHEICEDCGRCPHSCRCGAPARQLEDPHDGPNHHDYALGRDLPEVTP
ncbi:hypothetical protein [Streptomyces sp. NPDC056056]|uniref:hypothetical protein n=1 Tax=Streptomyces sp. NPDC056056 TaxID=3345698 RepID=UPI0035E31455